MAGEQAGGNPRFRGPGSLWKSSWRGRQPFSEMCCFSNFGDGATENAYVGAAGEPDIVPASGWFLGAVVGLQAAPSPTPGTIVRNGDANEGYELSIVSGPTADMVQFRFTVFDGAGIAAQVLHPANGLSIANVDDFNALFFSVIAGFVPDTVFVNGSIFLVVSSTLSGNSAKANASSGSGLASPYVNSNPQLQVGKGDGASALESPTCLAGLVGGVVSWTAGFQTEGEAVWERWQADVRAANQVVAVQGGGVAPIAINQNLWRAPNDLAKPVGDAPDPLDPVIGGQQLDYASGTGALNVECASPAVFFPDNLFYPFTSAPA